MTERRGGGGGGPEPEGTPRRPVTAVGRTRGRAGDGVR